MIRGRLKAATAPSAPGDVRALPGAATRRLGRAIYLLLVLGFAVYLLTTLLGQLIFLQATGIVSSERFVVGAAYTARVLGAAVKPGDTVVKGQRLSELESVEVLTAIAGLAERIASLDARRRSLLERQSILKALRPSAAARLERARINARLLAGDRARELASSAFQAQVLREAFDAERDQLTVHAEAASIETELAGLDSSRKSLTDAYDEARRSYAEGKVDAPVSGTVGTFVAAPGQVLRAGEPVLEILNGARFVLAYLPTGRLFQIEVGDEVILTNGVSVVLGRVERIEVVADNLPPEFRSTFGVRERRQIMRIVTDDPITFPFLSRVEVASRWSFTHLFAILKGWLSGRTASSGEGRAAVETGSRSIRSSEIRTVPDHLASLVPGTLPGTPRNEDVERRGPA